MKNQIISIILCLVSCLLHLSSYSQITRGAQPGEIYLSAQWYVDNYGQIHYAIFHSTDNGENLTLKYNNIETPLSGEMKIGKVLGDASIGTLYNYGYNELWVSFDYGTTWIFRENIGTDSRYSSGTTEGEIYKYCNNPTSFLYRSTDYGQTFEEINSGVFGFPEVGTNEGDFYMLTGATWPTFYIEILFSYDFGYTFSTIEVDSSIYGTYISGMFPEISRGTEPGELYFVSWWPDYHYKIFHSVDTGYTWIEKFESGYINIYSWGVTYTAGKQPGSFYVKRATPAPSGDHVWLYIDYSTDYGETFTTYFHDLDSTITGVITPEINNIKLSNYPNPFNHYTTFSFQLTENYKNPILNIFDIHGNLVRQINISGKKTQKWDGTDNFGKRVCEGMYLYNITCKDFSSQLNKLILTH